ncbi:anion permease, partial [Propionibacterium freudenreichii]|nr:anion permease [Propionibacterium freudenreichii]MDK9652442.1 anion permease [Propionibacterium freudenreichii]MDK9655288.1 anion permease [Propionibacterium freudenreichii]
GHVGVFQMGSVGTPIIGRPRPSHPPRHASQTQPPATPRIAKSPYTALLSMGLTQYSGGPGPALFGSGYNSTGRWWGVSFLCSIPSLLIWFVVGGAWFKVIGWW